MRALSRLGWVLLGVVAPSGILVATFGSGNVRDVAEQFQPPLGATAYEQRVTPRKVVCLGASPCPSLFRSWKLPRLIDPAELQGLMTAAGWELQPQGDCVPRSNSFARVALCSATGEVDGYAVTVTQLGAARTQTAVLTLDVRPLG